MRVRHVSLSADAIPPLEQSIGRSLSFEARSEMKALVPVGRNLITFLLVGGDAADIRHEDAGLFRNIGPDVPGVGQWIEGAVRHLVVVLHPGVFGLLLGL